MPRQQLIMVCGLAAPRFPPAPKGLGEYKARRTRPGQGGGHRVAGREVSGLNQKKQKERVQVVGKCPFFFGAGAFGSQHRKRRGLPWLSALMPRGKCRGGFKRQR